MSTPTTCTRCESPIHLDAQRAALIRAALGQALEDGLSDSAAGLAARLDVIAAALEGCCCACLDRARDSYRARFGEPPSVALSVAEIEQALATTTAEPSP